MAAKKPFICQVGGKTLSASNTTPPETNANIKKVHTEILTARPDATPCKIDMHAVAKRSLPTMILLPRAVIGRFH